MPMTILETLGRLPSGKILRLDVDGLGRYLREWRAKNRDTETERQKEIRMRIDFYRDNSGSYVDAELDKIFKDPKVKAWRKEFTDISSFQNLTRRVIREISTVYSEPARRKLKAESDVYRDFQHHVRLNRRMRKLNRMGNLTNEVLVWPDVTERGPVLRLVTQDKFAVLADPTDPLVPAMFIVDQCPTAIGAMPTDPHFLVMTEFEFFKLDKDWRVVQGTWTEHGIGRMPAMLWHREEPEDELLDWYSGKDLIAGHKAVAVLNTLLLKHQKSGTKVPYATGDTQHVARGQPLDEESLLELGEGVSLNTLDMGADPGSYIDTVRAVIKQVAANYGIPESVFDLSYQATSGFEIELKRTGLREIRRDQIMEFRPFEQDMAELWSIVLKAAGSKFAYEPDGWSIDFGEIDTPQDPSARLDYWTKLQQMGLANVIAMYMEMNPEATEAEAAMAIEQNLDLRIEHMRKFQAANPGLMDTQAPGESPPMDDEEEQAEDE